MISSWVIYWFLAVLIYVIGKAFKTYKVGSVPLPIFTNIIAIALGGYATWIMLSQGV